MRSPLAARSLRQRSASRFRLHLVHRRARLFVGQQLKLQVAQRLAARPQKLHALLPQLFRERLDFQMRPRQLAFEKGDARLRIDDSHE
jgi:hypothetical protein